MLAVFQIDRTPKVKIASHAAAAHSKPDQPHKTMDSLSQLTALPTHQQAAAVTFIAYVAYRVLRWTCLLYTSPSPRD